MSFAISNSIPGLGRHHISRLALERNPSLIRQFSSSSSRAPSAAAVVFFDGGCPLCAKEIGIYQRMIENHSIKDLKFIDISQAKNENSLTQHGITLEQAMFRMHALDSNGKIQSGSYAFITMWEKLPYWKWLAKIVAVPGVTEIVEQVYVFWAKRRNRLNGKEMKNDDDVVPGLGQSCRVNSEKSSKR